LDNGNYKLHVNKDVNLINYHMLKKDNSVVLQSTPENAFLEWQDWKFYWEQKRERLWIISADAGFIVWMKNKSNTFNSYHVLNDNAEIVGTVPRIVYNLDVSYFRKHVGPKIIIEDNF
jgi:hypothetical protein